MRVRDAASSFVSRLQNFRVLKSALIVFALMSASTVCAQVRGDSVLRGGYVSALAVADQFLQAWQTGDAENGIALLTEHAKKNINRDELDKFFSSSQPSAYEIERGKELSRGRFEFPVVLVSSGTARIRRRFSRIIVVNTGENGWAVDKLP
jgi:hypothetical protein